MLHIQITDLILAEIIVGLVRLRLQVNRPSFGTAEAGSGGATFAVIAPETRPDDADSCILRRRKVQSRFGVLAEISKNQVCGLTHYIAPGGVGGRWVGLVAREQEVPVVTAPVQAVTAKQVQFPFPVIQLQTAPLPVESPRPARYGRRAVGAQRTIFLKPDINNARIAGRVVFSRGVCNQLNRLDVIARHRPQRGNYILRREVGLFPVDLDNDAVFAA